MEAYTMVDTHMHLIPGVDDGAMTVSVSLGMISDAWNQGIRTICATPHSSAFDGSPERTRKRFYELLNVVEQVFLPREYPGLTILPGCELLCDIYAMKEILEKLRTGIYPTMNGTKYVLTEFSSWGTAEEALAGAKALAEAGYFPIIAHMERYSYLRDTDSVEVLWAMGCRIQVNAYSLCEEQDPAIRAFARQLIREKRVDFLGTDAHSTSHRPPSAASGLDWLYETCEKPYADAVACANAERLILKKEN